jgi:hypothetical protein
MSKNESVDAASMHPIVTRLRFFREGEIVFRPRDMDQAMRLMQEAADMLEFFFGQMQMHSPKMDGQHSYRFRGSGWPMTHCVGPNAEDAVKSALQEIQRSRSESA